MNARRVGRAENCPRSAQRFHLRATWLKGGLLLGRLFLRLLLLWGYRLGWLWPKLPTRRNRETLWRSRLLLLLLLALQFLQELFRSLDPWLLLLPVSLCVLVGWLILEPCGVVREVVVHLLCFLPRRNYTRWQGLRLACNRLIPRIRLPRSFRQAA